MTAVKATLILFIVSLCISSSVSNRDVVKRSLCPIIHCLDVFLCTSSNGNGCGSCPPCGPNDCSLCPLPLCAIRPCKIGETPVSLPIDCFGQKCPGCISCEGSFPLLS